MTAPMPATVIQVHQLKRDYHLGETVVHALRGVTMSVEAGEMVGIMGPSGSGKSTLMHLVGCLDTPTAGTIRIEGQDVSKLDEADLSIVRNRRVGFVFQQFNLLPRINVLENVATPLLYAGIPSRQRRERSVAALETVGLAERLRHKPNELSGGQRQRVAIARALVTEPSIILADEPTGNLDSSTGSAILEMFEKINRSGTTVVIVTHDQTVADICHRLVCLRDGVVESDTENNRAG